MRRHRARPSRTDHPRRPQRAAPALHLACRAGLLPAAAGLLVPAAAPAAAADGGISEVTSFATRLTNDVTAVAASVAVLFLAISGVRWTMSSGSPARQTEARNGLVAAATGLVIALSANVIVGLLVSALR